MMFRKQFMRTLGLGLAVLGLAFFVGCNTSGPQDGNNNGNANGNTNGNTNGNGNANGNDNFSPSNVTFGAERPDPATVAARPQAINPFAANRSAQLPSTADLTKDLPAIGDQGQLGSCTAWASGYSAATYTAKRQYGWDVGTADHRASPGYLYNELLLRDNLDCGSGTYITTAMNILIQDGCASLAVVDYTDQACPANPSGSDAANFRVGSFNRVVETDRNAVKGELAAGRIVVFGARLYDDFPQFSGSGVYRGSGNFLTQNNQHAAHAMSIVGYDDTRGAYRIMNSWSPQWGDAGFMWMAYETFEGTAFEAYSIEPTGDREPPGPEPDPGPGPGPEPGPDPQAFLDEAFQFADEDPFGGVLVYLVFFYHFDQPVYIRTVTVTAPSGGTGQQTYNTWYIDGYVYFVQSGGFQWEAGTYGLEFDIQTTDGRDLLYSGEAEIAPLDGGGGGEGLCSDICIFAYDGECDDGGPGALYALCDYGTDCDDCGVRDEFDGGGTICDDSCRFSADGECDDGGPNSLFDVCMYGTDCTDCGPRDSDGDIDGGGDVLCDDFCEFAGDGECDDGGLGAVSSACDFGSDCSDCGPRSLDDINGFRVIQRTFRGIPVKTPPSAQTLPAAGVGPTVLGANRQPVVVFTRVPSEELDQK